ncbi:MAG: rod shape-determining protein MreC, partial [Dehalococcoidia bacterium]|nr:rod shape-determining protein MreC [Dehalococcoidia bacterium]
MSARRVLWPVLILLLIFSSIYLQQNRAMLTIRSTAGDFLAPLQAAASGLTGVSKGFFDTFRVNQSLQQDNENLRQMVDDLRRRNVELWQTIAQQQKVMEEKGFQQANPQWNYLSARVIAWDPSNLVRTVVLDKGSSDGVGMGMVVVSSSGLAGKVVELSDRWSKVLLISDPRSSVNGMLQRSADGSKGILQGQPDGLLRMKYLQAESGVQKGDVVVTSGLGGGFPPGLFVGWILEVSYSDGQMFHEALVRPAANLSDLSDLMIVTNFAPLSLN